MTLYTVTFRGPDESADEARLIEASDDDGIIDLVGAADHPHAIDIDDGDRHVATFPPVRT